MLLCWSYVRYWTVQKLAGFEGGEGEEVVVALLIMRHLLREYMQTVVFVFPAITMPKDLGLFRVCYTCIRNLILTYPIFHHWLNIHDELEIAYSIYVI